MLALLAYVGSLIAAAAGVAMLFQLAASSGPSDNKYTPASAQVRKTTTGIAKPVSSASKAASTPVERRAEARKRKKTAVREKPRRRVAERRPEYWSPYYYSGRSYNRW